MIRDLGSVELFNRNVLTEQDMFLMSKLYNKLRGDVTISLEKLVCNYTPRDKYYSMAYRVCQVGY